jgi:transcriptional regulator with XRE-family HTH domain
MERERTLGKDDARRACLPIEHALRLLAGENPLLVWREHRELSRAALERACGLPRGRLAALERGDREASAKELAALADVLGAPFEELGAHDMASGEGRSSAPTEAATSPDVSSARALLMSSIYTASSASTEDVC